MKAVVYLTLICAAIWLQQANCQPITYDLKAEISEVKEYKDERTVFNLVASKDALGKKYLYVKLTAH